MDFVARGEVHERVRSPLGGPLQLGHLLADGAGHRRVADVRVHLHQELPPDDHRLGLRVVHVQGDDGAAGGDLFPHELDVALFPQRHETHLRGDDAAARVVHLGHAPAGPGTPGYRLAPPPLLPWNTAADGAATVVLEPPAAGLVDLDVPAGLDPLGAPGFQALLRNTARAHGAVHAQQLVGGAVRGVQLVNLGDGDLDGVLRVLQPGQAVGLVLLGLGGGT